MPIAVDARIVLAEDPMELEVRTGEPPAAAVLIADHGVGAYAGQQLEVEQLLIGEMVCRGGLASRALSLHRGDHAHVTGQLLLATALDHPHDGSVYVRLTISADTLDIE